MAPRNRVPEGVVQTTIRLPVPVWRALRNLAEAESLAHGGRASVSAAITRLIVAATGVSA